MGIFRRKWNRFHVSTFVNACKYGDKRQVLSMLKSEPELAYSKDERGISSLFHAVANGHDKIAEKLLDITNQANDVEPEKGFTPLQLATTNGNIALVKLLLDYGADPNLRNFDGVTALHNAVYEDQLEIISLLVDAGADPNIKDRHGTTAFDLAEESANSLAMNPLGEPFEHGEVNKNALIRKLVRLRVKNDPMAAAMGINEKIADSLSTLELAGLPEGTLVAIVETWSILRKDGEEDSNIFSLIEDHRSSMFPRGQMPTPLNLVNYIKYRIGLEHSEGAPIDEQFIDLAVDLAREAYGV